MNTDLREALLRLVKEWAVVLKEDIDHKGVFLFGSLVYRDGEQFNEETSDLDLVVLFPADAVKSAYLRAKWLEKLKSHKEALEKKLVEKLSRKNPSLPIVSVVPVTGLEISADIHKDGAHEFFSRNSFLNAENGERFVGLAHAGESPLADRLLIQCLRFAQKKRNEFVNVASNGASSFVPFDGDDPAPKDTMRYAAMAAALKDQSTEPGAEYDTQKGLDLLSSELYLLQDDERLYAELQDVLSVRRGARGTRRPLSTVEQILLAEIVRDVAVRAFRAHQVPKKAVIPKESTIVFNERFARAFPGMRGICWFEKPLDIKRRLAILLEGPLNVEGDVPIWWFGDGNLHIESFKEIEPDIFLMNVDELKVRRIAAVSGHTYYQNFVYIECSSMKPTGLYKKSKAYAAEAAAEGQTYAEEYGLLDDGHLITRAEFDDGAAVIDGSPVEIRGRAELRVRYLTPRNFVIAAHNSPINNGAFDRRLEEHLRAILIDRKRIEDLAADVVKLPKRRFLEQLG